MKSPAAHAFTGAVAVTIGRIKKSCVSNLSVQYQAKMFFLIFFFFLIVHLI